MSIVVLSFHSNEIGLFTIDGFKKQIKDLIFFSRTYTGNLSAYPELPQGGGQLYELNTYINNPIPIDVEGIETEWQTNFWYLPRPLDGLVLTLNYTHIFSDASYPRSSLSTLYDEEGNMTQAVSDTFYTTRLLNQPNDIVNLSFGYDYGGSPRVCPCSTKTTFQTTRFLDAKQDQLCRGHTMGYRFETGSALGRDAGVSLPEQYHRCHGNRRQSEDRSPCQ